jgi:UDP-N-acetylglucosamine--N-acetylmuramyl-(pentapeptide) pyrophosphoryl-undecaprenol N-acetylglucosamine transferase
MARRILIAAGGTGGHLYPGVAVADELRRRDPALDVVFVGTPRGLESRIVPGAGYPLVLLPVLPLNRVGLLRSLLGLAALPLAGLKAAALLLRRRPLSVLGVGGYAGGPLLLMAALLGIRTVILEPNAKPGLTNRILKPFATRAACAWEEARRWFGPGAVLTGNPVRGGFASLPEPRHESPLRLLAFGGSQGSRVLNHTLVRALPYLPGPERLTIVHQTGPSMRDEVERGYRAAARPAEVVAFLDPMERHMGEADLVVSRSGATTCAELAAAGRAAVLIPFAGAADDHQRINARAMSEAGAAVMLEERALDGKALARAVSDLVAAPERLAAMQQAARRLARPDAAARVADLLLESAA